MNSSRRRVNSIGSHRRDSEQECFCMHYLGFEKPVETVELTRSILREFLRETAC
jgi:hypothetical protein